MKKRAWKPEHGGKYYVICGNEVFVQQWEGDSFDRVNYLRSQMFKTKTQAESALKKIKGVK